WTNFYGGPGDLSTTIEAYWALRLAGDPTGAEHMRAAAEVIREHGGLAPARGVTHVWLSLFGLRRWGGGPAAPPPGLPLPPRVPLNIYDFGCWARQTIVALAIVKAHRPEHALPFTLAELEAQPSRLQHKTVSLHRAGTRTRCLRLLDRALRVYEHRPIAP